MVQNSKNNNHEKINPPFYATELMLEQQQLRTNWYAHWKRCRCNQYPI